MLSFEILADIFTSVVVVIMFAQLFAFAMYPPTSEIVNRSDAMPLHGVAVVTDRWFQGISHLLICHALLRIKFLLLKT